MSDELSMVIRALNLRPVLYMPVYKILTGSIHGGVLLSQIMYWHSRMGRDFYKTNQDFMDELWFTEREFRTARDSVKKLPFLKVYQKGIPAKTTYHIDYNMFYRSIKELIKENDLERLGGHDETVKPGYLSLREHDETVKPVTDETVKPITESTTESTTKVVVSHPSDDSNALVVRGSESEALTENKATGKGKPALKKTLSLPTEDDVIKFAEEFALKNGISKQKAIAEGKKAYAYYTGNMQEMKARTWKDGRGNTVKNWKLKIRNCWLMRLTDGVPSKKTPQNNWDSYAGNESSAW